VKYILDSGGVRAGAAIPDLYELTDARPAGKYYLYRNPYALPAAFMADGAILDAPLDSGNPFENQNRLLSALRGGEYYEYLKPLPYETELIGLTAEEGEGGVWYKPLPPTGKPGEGGAPFPEAVFTARPEQGLLVYAYTRVDEHLDLTTTFSAPPEEVPEEGALPGWVFSYPRTDGEPIYLCATPYRNGALTSRSPAELEGFFINDVYFYYLDEPAFEAAIEKLRQNPLELTSFKETRLTGTVDAGEGGVLFTTIVFEPGWSVWVDGVKTEPLIAADALLAIELDAGAHTIEMKFFPPGLAAGIAGTCLGLACLAALSARRKD
jgi:hypothetical protein